MNRNFVVLTLLALTVVVSGCASLQGDTPETGNETPVDDNSPEASEDADSELNESADSSEDSIREIVVEGGNYYFDSDSITVEQRETVRFVLENVGGTHDLRIPAFTAGTSVIQTGESESFEVTFDETGTFDFICSVGNHAQQGMTGTITVE